MATMNRRAFTAGLLGAPVGWAAGARPNILIYITDDESWMERSAYGWSRVPTPHFDRVAKEGVLFTRCYTSAPSCAPSRAALLTGRNFWELEQGAFIQAWLPAKFATLPELMEAGGYHSGFTGKGWGPGVLGDRKRNPAGNAWQKVKRAEREEFINDIDYAGNFAAFLDARPAGKPFWFWAGSTEPHGPYGKDNHKKLARYGIAEDAIPMPKYLPDNEAQRRGRADFAYEIKRADEDLGAILKVLAERGELDNTLIVTTADNGTAIRRAKTNVYDWGLRVPLAVRWPGRIPAARRVDDFVNFADFAPTMLEAAGLPVPGEMTGRSFLPVLTSGRSGRVDKARSWTAAGIEWHGELDPTNFAARVIRDERYSYVVNYGTRSTEHPGDSDKDKPRPKEELYDCEADPWQLKDLAAEPGMRAVKARLRKKLEAYQRQTKDPRATGEMAVFAATREFVQKRKRAGYKDGQAGQ